MRGLVVIVVALAVAVAGLWPAPDARASHIPCGRTITSDTVLDSDLVCSDRGIVIGAAGITLDLNGHQIMGAPQSSPRTTGIDNTGGHDGVRIENGVISSFRAAVRLTNAEANRVADLTITGPGVHLINSHRNILTGLEVNTVSVLSEVHLEASTENTLVGNTDTSMVLDRDADRNQVTDNTGGLYFVWNGSDDTVVTGNTEVALDLRDSKRAMIIGNEPSTIELANVDDSTIASNDITGSDRVTGLRVSSSSGTTIEGNRVSDPVAPGNQSGGFARSALLLHQSPDNAVIDNEFSGYEVGIELTGETDRNVISGNVISDHDVSGIRMYLADQNQIVSNELSSNGQYGIEFQLAANLNRIERNTVAGSGVDGVFVSAARSEGNVFEENTVSSSGDDGIQVDVANNTVTANSAHDNTDWGIEAVAGTIDGGANRAWSNGQAAQCLNVVCGPGPPAALTLSPESATNTVGDEHCVTATVTDPDGRATPGVTVRFAVDPSGANGAEVTDAGGTAQFCYDGPVAPRTDEIFAYADADADDTPDAGEPGATASKSWVLPDSSARCAVMGVGSIVAANCDAATFRMNVHVHKHRSRGSLFYEDQGPAESLVVRSSRLTSITCEGGSASVFGRTPGSAPLSFRIDVTDGPDTYRIRTSDGYDSDARPLTSGNIRVH